jgi:3D (Asp-Asp-Asp) domain-containing protein
MNSKQKKEGQMEKSKNALEKRIFLLTNSPLCFRFKDETANSSVQSKCRGFLFLGGIMNALEKFCQFIRNVRENIFWFWMLHKDDLFPIFLVAFCLLIMAMWILAISVGKSWAGENWKITSYCSCVKCCGKSDGITASGEKVRYGIVACNWLKFGTKVNIEGLGVFRVADRGAKSLFGSPKNHIKHLDVYLPSHSQALK